MQYAGSTIRSSVCRSGEVGLDLTAWNSVAGLIEGNSERLGFVLSCLFAEAISRAELHEWARKNVEECDAPPRYLTELINFDGPLFHIYELIGFAPHWTHTDEETLAIAGVAFKRERQPFDHPVIRQEALRELERNPEIGERFHSEFPFLTV